MSEEQRGHIVDTPICLKEEQWGDVKRHLESIDGHIETGEGWRKAIVVACIGLIGQLCLIGVVWGEMKQTSVHQQETITEIKETINRLSEIAMQIPVNTERITRIEHTLDKVTYGAK